MIPHNKLCFDDKEVVEVKRVIESGYVAQGKEVEEFENELCDFLEIERGHAIAVSSGTAAIYLAIKALDQILEFENVIIPAYSCSAVKNAVLMSNKTVEFVDIKKGSPNIDLHSDVVADSKVTIACHMYGNPMQINNPFVIEDCAQSIGACIDGNKVGHQSKVSAFSFYATKMMTTGGEGGAVVSLDDSLIEYLRDFREFDMKNDSMIRFNFQMTDIQAAIGRVQLRKLPTFIQKRKILSERYEKNGIKLWKTDNSINYRAIVKCDNPDSLIKYLNENDIGAINPFTLEELLCEPCLVPEALELTKHTVSIPIYPSLSLDEQDYIIRVLKNYKDGELIQ